jgi:methionine biosynthesis protein MetW
MALISQMNTSYSMERLDARVILDMVTESSSVLDLGCGDGELLSILVQKRGVKAQGIEIDEKAIFQCVARGLSVFQDDIDSGLSEYEDGSFDFVILNQTFQQVKKPDLVIREALRVGRKAIIGFPNFANLDARIQIFLKGRAPVTPSLPYQWYDTPNLHFLSILDFFEYCRKQNVKIERTVFLGKKHRVRILPNLLAQVGIFMLSKG